MNKIILFAKYPELGKVKTRLAKDIGNEPALRIYSRLLHNTLTMMLECNFADKVVYLGEDKFLNHFKQDYPQWEVKVQSGGDLGERLINAMNCEMGLNTQLIFIGADCPEITSRLILSAIKSLQYHDIVIGPATDGGYYLIGLRNHYPQLFCGIDWSTDKVFFQTKKAAEKLHLRIFDLPYLTDIDTAEDWEKYQSRTQIGNL